MKENVHIIDSDILIIGSGIAGLSAAMAASKSGKKVLRQGLLTSKTYMQTGLLDFVKLKSY